nr:hypothetical protein [Myxococcales bacterium]
MDRRKGDGSWGPRGGKSGTGGGSPEESTPTPALPQERSDESQSFPLPQGPLATLQPPAASPTPPEDLLLAPPSVELPKGGGAIQGIGETFRANPVTGTASLSLPVALTPGRGGVAPQLALSYDSGAG